MRSRPSATSGRSFGACTSSATFWKLFWGRTSATTSVIGFCNRSGFLGALGDRSRRRTREIEQIVQDLVDSFRLLAHPGEKVVLLTGIEPALKEQIFEPEKRRDRVADLVSQTGGQAAHRRQALGPDETVLRLAQLVRPPFELVDLVAHSLFVGLELLRHSRQRPAEVDQLGGAPVRDVQRTRAGRHSTSGTRELVDRRMMSRVKAM